GGDHRLLAADGDGLHLADDLAGRSVAAAEHEARGAPASLRRQSLQGAGAIAGIAPQAELERGMAEKLVAPIAGKLRESVARLEDPSVPERGHDQRRLRRRVAPAQLQ